MSEPLQFQITFLLDSEIRTAAKALRAVHAAIERDTKDDENAPLAQETRDLLFQALDAATVALWHAADDERPLMLVNAEVWAEGVKKKRRRARSAGVPVVEVG